MTVGGKIAVVLGGLLGGAALIGLMHRSRRSLLRGPSMVSIIARESKTADEYARRVEAWNAGERDPLPVGKLARAYRKASPSKVAKLIREAHEQRIEGRERLWSRMSRGLRGAVTEKQQRMFKRGVEAMRRALKGAPDAEVAFNVAIRGSKDPDFAAGVRTAFNLASSKGNREAAQTNLVKYGFKSG